MLQVGDIVEYIYHEPTDYVKTGYVSRYWEDDYWFVLWFDDNTESDHHANRLRKVS
jgi:hypothetical protein